MFGLTIHELRNVLFPLLSTSVFHWNTPIGLHFILQAKFHTLIYVVIFSFLDTFSGFNAPNNESDLFNKPRSVQFKLQSFYKFLIQTELFVLRAFYGY